ncbi:hypothetical protein BKA70DRAFT_1399643 [Coprinopsis sp. MPI-PUGE-AT-0042]|nr:hypothetical protein BKA70DRAFT_1399643 [Coprinopsis sp. MPI-PUGE-AT-0042]
MGSSALAARGTLSKYKPQKEPRGTVAASALRGVVSRRSRYSNNVPVVPKYIPLLPYRKVLSKCPKVPTGSLVDWEHLETNSWYKVRSLAWLAQVLKPLAKLLALDWPSHKRFSAFETWPSSSSAIKTIGHFTDGHVSHLVSVSVRRAIRVGPKHYGDGRRYGPGYDTQQTPNCQHPWTQMLKPLAARRPSTPKPLTISSLRFERYIPKRVRLEEKPKISTGERMSLIFALGPQDALTAPSKINIGRSVYVSRWWQGYLIHLLEFQTDFIQGHAPSGEDS